MKLFKDILLTIIVFLILCNVIMYLTGYSAFDDWRINKLIGRTWAALVSRHFFIIIAIIPGIIYLIVDRKIKKRTRNSLIDEFEDDG